MQCVAVIMLLLLSSSSSLHYLCAFYSLLTYAYCTEKFFLLFSLDFIFFLCKQSPALCRYSLISCENVFCLFILTLLFKTRARVQRIRTRRRTTRTKCNETFIFFISYDRPFLVLRVINICCLSVGQYFMLSSCINEWYVHAFHKHD